MPALFAFTAAAAGGRVVPAKPTLTHAPATGQFQITNYDATLTYTITVTAGTATRSGDIITMSNANSIATVTARLPKSISDSPAATAERREYSFFVCQSSGPHNDCGPCAGFDQCADFGAQGFYCFKYCKNATPAGYTDSFGEWWKVT